MRLAATCPASWNVKGDRRTLAAQRGTAVHEFHERYCNLRAEAGRPTDIAGGKSLIPQILEKYGHLPPEIQEEVQQLCQNIIDTHLLNLESYYGAEETFTADLGATVLTGRLDELHVDGDEAEIIDCKSNHIIPSPATVAGDFQLKTYGYLICHKLPQIGQVKGTIFTPRFGTFRSANWDRDELLRWGEHLARLANSLESSDKKEAVPNPNCQYCAASLPGGGCPAWKKTYGLEVVIRSGDEAVEAAKQILALEQRLKSRRAVLQAWCKDNGHVSSGGREFGYFETASQVIDVRRLKEAVPEVDPFDFLSVSAGDIKRLRKILDKDADAVLADISDIKHSTRFGHRAIQNQEEE